jgi:hypothetical protein
VEGLVGTEEAEATIWEEGGCVCFCEVVEWMMDAFVACEG